MDGIIEENDSMKRRTGCGILKTKTNFYFIKNNQKLRKKCAQSTKIKQRVYNSENKEKIKMYAKQNKEKTKEYENNSYKTDINFQISRKTRSRIYKALKEH